MSPFPVAGDFVKVLADIFQDALEDEVTAIVAENTISNQYHAFILQGPTGESENQVYLVYRPLFYNANSRFQLILEAKFQDKSPEPFAPTKKNHPSETYVVQTLDETTIAQVLKERKFEATISGKGIKDGLCTISDIKVVKNRPLDSMYRDTHYPVDNMPFYLYGSSKELHVDHMLLFAPNAQLTAEGVKCLFSGQPIPEDELKKGVIALFSLREITMQPFRRDANDPSQFFKPDATFNVVVYKDSKPAAAHGPGLAQVSEADKLCSGTITLSQRVFTDVEALNPEEFSKLLQSKDANGQVKLKRCPCLSRDPNHRRGMARCYPKEQIPPDILSNLPDSLRLPVSGPLGDLWQIRQDTPNKKLAISERAEWRKIIDEVMGNLK
jgi:hypothetical protein